MLSCVRLFSIISVSLTLWLCASLLVKGLLQPLRGPAPKLSALHLQYAFRSRVSRLPASAEGTTVVKLHRWIHMYGSSIGCRIFFMHALASCSKCFEKCLAQNIYAVSLEPTITPHCHFAPFVFFISFVILAIAYEERWLLLPFLWGLDFPLPATFSHPHSRLCFQQFFCQPWQAFGFRTRCM